MAQDFDKIAKLLSDIQRTNNSNADNFERILSGISSKLEKSLSSSDTELFKGYINELVKSLDDRYEQTIDKFGDIEKALKALYETQDSHVKNTDMKELFDMLSKNINNFYSEARQEKAILAGIETKLADFSSNKTDKEDILRTISLMRNDMGNINISYKNTIDDINSTLKSILTGIKSFDPLKRDETTKAQIEIMFKAINDIIANLHEIDNRESNLEKVLSNVVTTEDLKVTNGIINSIIEKTNEIEEKLSNNAQKDDLTEIHKALAFIYDKSDLNATKDELLKVDEKTTDLFSQTDNIKQTLSKIAKDIENIPDSSELEISLKKLYTHIYDIADSIEAINVKSEVSDINNKLDAFKDELSLIQNIISDCNEAITARVIKTVELISFSNEDIKKSVLEIVEKVPTQDDIEQILNSTDKIYEKIEQINDGLSDISIFVKNNSGFDSDYIKTQLNEIKSMIESGSYNTNNFDSKSSFDVSDVKEYLNELKNIMQDNPKGALYSKVMDLEDALVNNQTFNESAFNQILSKITNFKGLEQSTENDEQISNSISEITSLKIQIEKLQQLFEKKDEIVGNNFDNASVSEFENFIHEKFNQISDDLEKLEDITSGKIAEGFASQAELLEEKTSAIQSLLSNQELIEHFDNPEFVQKVSKANETLNDFNQELQLISTDITENISSRTSQVLDELNSIKELLHKISDNIDPSILKNKISNLNDELTSNPELADYRTDIDNLYSELSMKFSDNENNLKDFMLSETDSIILKFEDLKAYVEDSLKLMVPLDEKSLAELRLFTTDIEQFKQSQNIFISEKIEEVKDEIKTQCDELKSMLTVATNHEDIIEAIEALKTTFRSYKSRSKSKAKNSDSSDTISYSADDIEDLRSDFEKYSKKIEQLSDDNSKIVSVLQSISERLEKESNSGSLKIGREIEDDEITEYVEKTENEVFGEDKFDFIQAFDILQNDIRFLKSSIDEVKQNTEDKGPKIPALNNSGLLLNISSKLDTVLKELNNNWLEDLEKYIATGAEDINAQLTTIDSKLDIFVADTTNTDILTEVSDSVNDLNDKIAEIEPKIQKRLSVSDKKLSYMFEELSSQISEILEPNDKLVDMFKELSFQISEISSQNEGFDELKNLIGEQKNYIEALEPNEKLNTFKNCLDELSAEINSLVADSNNDTQKIQKTINDMKESLMSAVISVCDQVSFIEESEDIKDFVEERTDELNEHIKDFVEERTGQINDRITEITKQLQQITSSEENSDNNYTYTMQDIETDLAKLRMALQNSKQFDLSVITDKLHSIISSVDSLSQDEMRELKTEISNLKEQTQFLIATSDKSYNALNSGIEGFEQVINDSISDKVDKLYKMLEDSAQSDKVIKQALVYMGEWIDSASESINKISANSDQIVKINDLINEIKDIKGSIDTNINDKVSNWNIHLNVIEKQFSKIENLEKQFEQQQERIERLEFNIDRLLSVVENLEDPAISRKMDRIEKQLSKLSTNIDKLASYVD